MLIDLSNNIIFSQLLPIIMRLARMKCIASSMQNKQGVRVIIILETGRPHTLTINWDTCKHTRTSLTNRNGANINLISMHK